MLFLDNNPEKSFTVSVFTVLCKILVSSSDPSESLLVISSNELFICSPSSVDKSLIGNVEINPIITATIDVIIKTLINYISNVFPKFSTSSFVARLSLKALALPVSKPFLSASL